MKQFYTVASATNMLSSMTMIVTTSLWWISIWCSQYKITHLVQWAIAHNTRSQSSLDSVQIAGKSSKELKDLAQQLLIQSEKLESEERVSSASSEASVNRNPVDPFQDSEDPYNGYNLDSN